MYFPNGVKAPDVIPRLLKKDVVVAGGLHKDHKGSFSPSSSSQRITDVVRGRLQTSISASGAHVPAHLCHWVSTNRGRRHMGVTVVKEERGDVDKIIAAVKESISEALAEASKKA